MTSRQILFLCTGNYYRSRFAEMLFNHLAAGAGLDWRAQSRGLATETNHLLPGVISAATVLALAALEIPQPDPHRDPITCCEADLSAADRIIALKEAEHRPLLRSRHPGWEDRVEYWHFHDVDAAAAAEMLPQLETRVRSLVEQLAREGR